MKDILIYLLSFCGGIAGLYLFIKLTFHSLRNEIKKDKDTKDIHKRISQLETKDYVSVKQDAMKFDDLKNNKIFNSQ